MVNNKEKLVIFDTTLRDGEQSPGASMNPSEKLRIAKILEKLNVDVIEAGFPIASKGDFDAVKNIASSIKDSTICALARAMDKDIDSAGEALKSANSSRIHTFIATSEIHMQKKLNMSKKEVIDQAIKSIKRIKKYTDNIEFSPEDAGRSEFDFLCNIIEKAIAAGADYIAFGAFHSTKTKRIKYKASFKILKSVKKITATPIVAIGGIKLNNYKRLLLNKANFLAISGYIWNNKKYKPLEAIKKLK